MGFILLLSKSFAVISLYATVTHANAMTILIVRQINFKSFMAINPLNQSSRPNRGDATEEQNTSAQMHR